MQKLLCIGVLVFCLLVSACSSENSQPAPSSSSASSAAAETSAPAESGSSDEALPDKLSEKAGIGDTLEAWTDDHGTAKGNDMIRNFENETLVVVFADNRAVNITFQKNKTGKKPNELIKQMMPGDAAKISEEEDTSDQMLGKHKEKWHSDLLAKAMPESKGDITIIDVFDKASGKYIKTVIDCTPQS